MSGGADRSQGERRQFYRIADRIKLRYETIEAGSESTGQAGGAIGLSTGQLLGELDDELAECINLLGREDPLAARALGLLNRKVSLLATLSLSEDGDEAASYKEMLVSLSGCGLAFEAGEQLPPGTALKLWLILQPSQLEVSITGRVVDAAPAGPPGESRFWTRVDFDDEAWAREELIRHVVQKQGLLVAERSEQEKS